MYGGMKLLIENDASPPAPSKSKMRRWFRLYLNQVINMWVRNELSVNLPTE